jgi:hypothetical protein
VIRSDCELLARLAGVNAYLGAAVVELVIRQDVGELPAEGVRDLGRLGSWPPTYSPGPKR